MTQNAIIAEIHRYREQLARAHDFDPEKLCAYFRAKEAAYAAKGGKFVSFAAEPTSVESAVVREKPPKP